MLEGVESAALQPHPHRRTMKVVLFCGGLGTRLREYSDAVPKPMVPIGNRPILWHVMKYYAYFGHRDFVLCLGYRADAIKEYFLRYSEEVSNDFVLSAGGKHVELLNSDIDDWRITFVDTGANANIGDRLRAVRSHVENEEVFLANYADGVTDLWLPAMINDFEKKDVVGSFMAVRPPLSFHVTGFDEDGYVTSMMPIRKSGLWVNAGYFVFRQQIFGRINTGEELVIEPFQRLAAEHQLVAYPYEGYWGVMDTFKDKQALDDLHERGPAPWEVWKTGAKPPTPRS